MSTDLDAPVPAPEAPTEANAGYSRVTMVGRRARADLVLPSTEPIGVLMHEILDVLGEDTAGRPRRRSIATSVGDVLPPDLTLVGAGVLDGAVLRLVDEDEIPPPPVVNDVTEETAGDLERHVGRWGAPARIATATSAAAVLAALAALEIVAREPEHRAFVVLLSVSLGTWAVGLGLGVLRRRHPAVAVAACGAAFALVGLATVAPGEGWTRPDRIGALVVAGAVVLAIGGFALRSRGPLAGAVVGAVLAGGWIVLRRTDLHPHEADALVAVAAVVVLGVLPQWAVTYSGLTSLDDRRMSGRVVSRRHLERALLAAHSGLVWCTVTTASMIAVTGVSLGLAGTRWPGLLAGAVALVTLLRGRSFPLVAEVVAVSVASLAVLVALEYEWAERTRHPVWPLVTTLVAAGLLIAALVADPPAHVRARLRMLGDRLETLGVIALVPVVIGLFGVFGRLLHTF